MLRYSILVSGRVQGVGFRYHAQYLANQHGLTGWVKNLDNGMVSMEVQGTKERIALFLSELGSGNRFIRVDQVVKKEQELQGSENEFRVIY